MNRAAVRNALHLMMRRWGLLLPLLLLLTGCEESGKRFSLLSTQKVNGRTYLLVENSPAIPMSPSGERFFDVYAAEAGHATQWSAKVRNRQGPVYGTFVYVTPEGEQLGIFHPNRISLFRFEEGEKESKSTFVTLPFKWHPETGSQLGSTLFVFGGIFPKETQVDRFHPEKGRVGVAKYDGKAFTEVKLGNPPVIKAGRAGFWLASVAHQGKVHLFWRPVEGPHGLDMEPPFSLKGPMKTVVFDGEAFGDIKDVANLPPGFCDIWSDGNRLRAVVQPQDTSFGRSPPLRLFTLPPEGPALEENIVYERSGMRLRIKYYNVARLPGDPGDAFLRTNSQAFEVWRATPSGWRIDRHPNGLPTNDFESILFSLFGFSVLIMAAGVGLAYRRRQQVRLLLRKLKPSDVLASLSLRISAYLIDFLVAGVITEVTSRILNIPSAGLLFNTLFFQVAHPFFVIYMLYLTLMEWSFGASLGKLALGLRVVTSKGKRLTIWAALVRNMIGFFERHPMLAGFAALPTIILTPRSQRLGDLLAQTIVVQKTAMDRFYEERAETMSMTDAYGVKDDPNENNDDVADANEGEDGTPLEPAEDPPSNSDTSKE